jgi:hypothetical protein
VFDRIEHLLRKSLVERFFRHRPLC